MDKNDTDVKVQAIDMEALLKRFQEEVLEGTDEEKKAIVESFLITLAKN